MLDTNTHVVWAHSDENQSVIIAYPSANWGFNILSNIWNLINFQAKGKHGYKLDVKLGGYKT